MVALVVLSSDVEEEPRLLVPAEFSIGRFGDSEITDVGELDTTVVRVRLGELGTLIG